MSDPGKILQYNADDDNVNNAQDRSDPAPFKDALGNAVNDNDLKPAQLSYDARGLDLTGFVLTLEIEGSNVKLWKTQDKQFLPMSYTIGTDTIPSVIYAEGYNFGTDIVDWILKNPEGTEIYRDKAKFSVMSLDEQAFRPQTEVGYGDPFQRTPVPFKDEISPGVGIRLNGDDDDGSGTADKSQTGGVRNENDLIEVDLNANPASTGGVSYWLVRSDANIRVWNSNDKVGAILLDNDSSMVPLGKVWVEWVGGAPDPDATLTFQVRDGDNVALADNVRFFPFTSVAIALGGEFQVPSDPPDPNAGTFVVADYLYNQGYDVHMYDEDQVPDDGSLGAAYEEVFNAVHNRGVTEVAIFGYSHGAGATYMLASQLQAHSAEIGAFSLVFTSYVDAIQKPTVNTKPETRLPPGSLYHINQYQLNDDKLHAAPTVGAAVNLDRSDFLNSNGEKIKHVDIDNVAAVMDYIEQAFQQHVAR